MRGKLLIALVTPAYFLGIVSLYGQAVGGFVGTVVDPSEAVVANAQVTAVNKGTGLTRSTLTSSSGTYSLPTLPVGTYTVSAEASGFKSASIEAALDVNQSRDVDFTLTLSGATAKVEVRAAPAMLNTTTAILGSLVNEEQVSTLPLNGRDVVGLVFLQPGVVHDVDTTGFHTVANQTFSNNGNRAQSGASTMDGFDTTDYDLGGGQYTNFNLDAIGEFRVLQNNYSAAYGGGAGSITELVTKSGKNQVHGSAFEFIRNNALDARNWFSTSVPNLKRNEFGATFGGPLSIPHIYSGKNRTFFFLEYAGFRQAQTNPAFAKVPTSDERNGVVDITGANGQPDQLMVALNSVAKTVMSRYPLPNNPTGEFGANTFSYNSVSPKNTDQGSLRIDQRFSDKDTLFVRATQIDNALPVLAAFEYLISPSWTESRTYNEQQLGLGWTHIFSPTFLNNFRLSDSRSLENLYTSSVPITFTSFSDNSLTGLGPEGGGFGENPWATDVHDSVNWVKGRHSVEIGGGFVHIREDNWGGNSTTQGTYTFSPGTALPIAIPSASGLDNIPAGTPCSTSLLCFMEGIPLAYTHSAGFPGFGTTNVGALINQYDLRQFLIDGYIEDDIKLTRKLTLNLGFRYEYHSVPYERYGRTAGVLNNSKSPEFMKFVLNVDPLWRHDYRGFGPRFGLAYNLTQKTVLRGGYGIFTNIIPLQFADDPPSSNLAVGTGTEQSPPYSLTPLSIGTSAPVVTDLNGNVLPPGGRTGQIPPNTVPNLAPIVAYLGGPLSLYSNDYNLHNGYVSEGNVTLERELPGGISMHLSYVGNNGVGLFGFAYPNAYPGAAAQYAPYTAANNGDLSMDAVHDNHAHSTYNALQAMVLKTSARHGLQFQGSFTWSKLISNADATYGGPAQDSASELQDPECTRCEKGDASMDFPKVFESSFLYGLPFDKWSFLSASPKALTKGWQVTSILSAQSGYPFTIDSPVSVEGFGNAAAWWGTQGARPDLIQTPPLNSGGAPANQFFSNAVLADAKANSGVYFSVPGCPQYNCTYQTGLGTLGRNTFRSPGFWNLDVSILKDTRLSERFTLQFRAEFFNILNLHAFNIPGTILGSGGFGVAGSTVLSERQIQFGLRLIF